MHNEQLTLFTLPVILVYILLIVFIYAIVGRTIYAKDKKLYHLLIFGLLIKILGGIAFAMLYEFHYRWAGDTFYYFRNSCYLAKTFWNSPLSYFRILFDTVDASNIGMIDTTYYNPLFRLNNASGIYSMHRFTSVFAIAGFDNYYLISILMNGFLYLLNWKVFCFVDKMFPNHTKITFIAFMCVPSVILFSSGIMKDAYVYSFSGMMLLYLYRLFFDRQIGVGNIIKLLFSVYVVYSLKPYVLFALFLAFFVWFGFTYLYKVKNKVLRVIILPIVMVVMSVVALYGMTTLGNMLGGKYASVDAMVESASLSQYDLKQDYYQGQSFDIGGYDDVNGAVSVAPLAIIAGLYRPFLWEVRSAAMLFSGVENFVLLLISIYVILVVGLKKTYQLINENLFFLYCLIFTLLLACGVGLSTSNFGALVRFRIPFVPYFFFILLYISNVYRKSKNMPLVKEDH